MNFHYSKAQVKKALCLFPGRKLRNPTAGGADSPETFENQHETARYPAGRCCLLTVCRCSLSVEICDREYLDQQNKHDSHSDLGSAACQPSLKTMSFFEILLRVSVRGCCSLLVSVLRP